MLIYSTMKNILTQEQIAEIDAICKKYSIWKYTINNDGSIDCHRDVFMRLTKTIYEPKGGVTQLTMKFEKIPVVFNKVAGDFNITGNIVKSLKGSPREVGGDFKCNKNLLTSLEGAPKVIGGEVNCKDNPNLPLPLREFLHQDNQDQIKAFLKYQDHYEVWHNGFNEEGFNELMAEIEEGLL